MGETANEVSPIREAGDHPPGRALPSAGPAHLGQAGVFRRPYSIAGTIAIAPLTRPVLKIAIAVPAGCGTVSRTVSAGQSVELALDEPELSPRELAVTFIDAKGCFISEASVYRLLKAHREWGTIFQTEPLPPARSSGPYRKRVVTATLLFTGRRPAAHRCNGPAPARLAHLQGEMEWTPPIP